MTDAEQPDSLLDEPEPTTGDDGSESEEFDFDAHRRDAVDSYEPRLQEFDECAGAVRSVLTTVLRDEGILYHSLEARAKTPESLGEKAATPSESDPEVPKYPEPLDEITDLSAVRVITYLLDVVEQVNEIVRREFDVIEEFTRSGLLEKVERVGYQSTHFIVRFSKARCGLPEYARFADIVTEIQVRTILQHAWAEIEHDIQYKAPDTIPTSIRRRFASLAGLVEIADREFQAISTEDQARRNDARRLIADGALDQVEITSDALKAYLDAKLGPDGRQSAWSYEWATRILKALGFSDLGAISELTAPYDDDLVSRVLWRRRQGQLSRFLDVVMAALGETYVNNMPWSRDDPEHGYAKWARMLLERLEGAGIKVGAYASLPRYTDEELEVEPTPPPSADDPAQSNLN